MESMFHTSSGQEECVSNWGVRMRRGNIHGTEKHAMQSFHLSEQSQKRWSAWWQCEVLDRPLLLTGYTNKSADPMRPLPPGNPPMIPMDPPEDSERRRQFARWFNIDEMIRMNLERAARWQPAYESTMQLDTSWSVAYCLPFGVQADYNEYAAWCDPLPGMTCTSDLVYAFDGPWHRWLVDGTRRMAKAGRGLYYVTPVMWGNHSGDTLSNLVGINQLMTDCMDRPQDVRRALESITDAQIRAFAELRALEGLSALPGSRNYTGTWSPSTGLSFDCDISAMLSPRMYHDICLPPLERMMATVDHRIYHLDGPVCLQHLPTLLSLEQLQAIQWVAGAGNEELTQWYDLYERIQAAGKAIIVYAHYDQVLDICKRLKPEGLAISFWSPSENKMHEMAERVEASYRS
ncbi:MAG: hypothetical protein ACYC4R_02960 [Anaerolineae bacterium]